MAPAASLARLRKHVLDQVTAGVLTMVAAAAQLGISRSRLYELRDRYERYGEVGLFPKPRPRGRHPRALSPAARDAIVAYAIEHPTEGPRTIAARLGLARFGAWKVSHGSVYNVLRDAGLGRARARLAAAEALAAAEGGPVTERALRDLRAIEVQHRHIGSDTPGEQVFFDTMYIGNLKGVGKLWQYSAVDGATSFGIARVAAGKKSAARAAAFLEHDVVPVFQELHIGLMSATVDGGPEFQRDFRASCTRLGITRDQLPARSPNLNAFVERFQGSCLHLHYRNAFRYRFYESADDVDDDLQAWLRFYNFERPHRGYRLRGRSPATVLYRNHPEILTAKGWEPHELPA